MLSIVIPHSPIGYFGIFVWFLFLDQLTPIPEEVTLLSIGYLAEQHLTNPYFAGLSAFLGLTIIDNLFYWLAFSGNKLVLRVKNKIGKKLQDKYVNKLKDNTVETLLLLSFIPKIRFFSPIFAGIFHVKWRIFFIVNGIGTIVFIIVYIALGMFFHNSLEYIIKELDMLRHSIFVVFLIVMTVLVLFVFKKKNK